MEFLVDDSIAAASDRPETLEQPVLRDLYRYWTVKRGLRPWPVRGDIDPLDLKPLLGWIAMLDVIHDDTDTRLPPRFRYRLFGTAFVEWFGFDMTGRMIDDWPAPEYRAVMNESYREVVAAGRPFRRLRRFIKDQRMLRYEALMLPLGSETAPERVGRIIVAQVFQD